MDSWLVETILTLTPTVGRELVKVYDKIKGLREEEQFRVLMLFFLAQLVETNTIMNQKLDALNRKVDSANENLAVLLERTKKA
jgi:hypothetical protein